MTGTLEEFVLVARERLTARRLLLNGVVVAGAYALTREPASAVGVALGLTVLAVVETLGETDGVDDRWITGGIGLFVTVGSLAWLGYELTTESSGPVWFPALTALAGGWFLLDARSGTTASWADTENRSFGETVLVTQHVTLIANELDAGPKTVPELAAACDLTESRVREALSAAAEDGVVYRTADTDADGEPRYALDESKTGLGAAVRLAGRRLLRRVARPLRR